MKKPTVIVLTKNPLLKRILEQVLRHCEHIEIARGSLCPESPPDAMIIDTSFLSKTDREVLQAVASLGGIRKASEALCRSERTLKRELATIRQKLGFHTTIELIVWAVYYGVVDPYAPQGDCTCGSTTPNGYD